MAANAVNKCSKGGSGESVRAFQVVEVGFDGTLGAGADLELHIVHVGDDCGTVELRGKL